MARLLSLFFVILKSAVKNLQDTHKHVLIHTYEVFQVDFEIFRSIASFVKISSGRSLIIKLIFIKFFKTILEIGGKMSRDQCLAESLHMYLLVNMWLSRTNCAQVYQERIELRNLFLIMLNHAF
jgi:hypothetical protein